MRQLYIFFFLETHTHTLGRENEVLIQSTSQILLKNLSNF